MGVYLGYKIKTEDGHRLVTADDLEGAPKNAEHVLIQEYQDDDYFTGKERYYIELETTNPVKMAMLSKEKGIDGALGRFTKETGAQEEVAQPEQVNTSLSLDTPDKDIASAISVYDAPITTTMMQLGVDPAKNIVSRSLLLALASGSDDVEVGIGQLVRMFNANTNPELNQALVSGNSKEFFDLYLEGLVSQGYDKEMAIQHLVKVDRLRDKIQKAYN